MLNRGLLNRGTQTGPPPKHHGPRTLGPCRDKFRFACNRINAKLGDPFLQSDLNEAAGAADASRAMFLTSCRKVVLLTSIFAFL
jgi:hypothetical protein